MKLEETLRSQRVFGDRSSRADQSESNRERVFNPPRAFRTSAIYLGSVKFFQTSTSTIETFTQRFSLLQFFFFFPLSPRGSARILDFSAKSGEKKNLGEESLSPSRKLRSTWKFPRSFSSRYTERRYLIGREEVHPPLASSPRSRTPAREIPEDRFERARLRAVSGIGPLNALIPPPPRGFSEKKTSSPYLSPSIHFSSPNSRPRNVPCFARGKPLHLSSSFFPTQIHPLSLLEVGPRSPVYNLARFWETSVGTRDPKRVPSFAG